MGAAGAALEARLGQEVHCTWLDVLPHDGDMAVPVWPCVLVPEANDVAQLVDHDAKLVTVLANGDGLGAPTSATHVGAAPGGRGQLRGAVPSWGSASTQGPGQAAAQGSRGVEGQAGRALTIQNSGCVPGSEPQQEETSCGRRELGDPEECAVGGSDSAWGRAWVGSW